VTAVTAPGPDVGTGPVTQSRVIRAEWIKLRSLRSTGYSLLATVVIVVALGTLFSALRAHRYNQDVANGTLRVGRHGAALVGFDPTLVSLRGVFLAQLAIGVLGVLVITGEYATGMIRSSLAAVPHRQPVLVAKALVFAAAAFAVSLASAFFAFLLGQQALASTHGQASLSTPGAWRAILGAAVYLTLIGTLGVGLGFLIRSTAGAIATLFGIVLVLPLLAQALPSPYSTDVTKYLPLSAGTRILSVTHPDPTALGPWIGIGLTALYALAALIAGAVALARRDG